MNKAWYGWAMGLGGSGCQGHSSLYQASLKVVVIVVEVVVEVVHTWNKGVTGGLCGTGLHVPRYPFHYLVKAIVVVVAAEVVIVVVVVVDVVVVVELHGSCSNSSC